MVVVNPAPEDPRFPATRWSIVLRAGELQASAVSRRALGDLCQAYWYPLYAFARRLGHSIHDAQDLTQGFFAYALERNLFATADPSLGKLRTFLLTAFQRYARDLRKRDDALKRGGPEEFVHLDPLVGEARYAAEPADLATPERLYERTWALTVLNIAMVALAAQEAAAGRELQFQTLEPFISPSGVGEPSYALAAARLGLREEAVRQAVARLRRKFRTALRRQIADTLQMPTQDQVDEEISALRAALRP